MSVCFDVIAVCNNSVILYAFIHEYWTSFLSRNVYLCELNNSRYGLKY
jgi:hypothetical protein